jgi:hypothetical protein
MKLQTCKRGLLKRSRESKRVGGDRIDDMWRERGEQELARDVLRRARRGH